MCRVVMVWYLCQLMRMVRIHSLSGMCPRIWLPKIYIDKGMHWSLRFNDMNSSYLGDVYLYLCWSQAFPDHGPCSSVCIGHILGNGLDLISSCEDWVVFGFGQWVIEFGIEGVTSVGSSSAPSGGYKELWWLDQVWFQTVGMRSYEGWISLRVSYGCHKISKSTYLGLQQDT